MIILTTVFVKRHRVDKKLGDLIGRLTFIQVIDCFERNQLLIEL